MALAARHLTGVVLDEAGCAGVPDARRRLLGPGSPDEDTSDGFTEGMARAAPDEEFDRVVGTWLGEADAFLFGRRTYQNFARTGRR